MIFAAVDTGALLALASSRDQYHDRARAIATRYRRSGARWLGTTLVLAELHAHLLRRLGPGATRRVLAALLDDPSYDWRDASVDLVRAAGAGWIDRYADQRFSLTDAVTFELMRQERVSRAFAFDGDFETAGFELLT